MRTDEDAMFWDRVADMPAWEAEQELVLRRERVISENEELAPSRRDKGAGLQIMANARLLTQLNERIRYLRKLQDAIQWRESVREVLGDEAVALCLAWQARQYGHKDDRRRQWASRGVARKGAA